MILAHFLWLFTLSVLGLKRKVGKYNLTKCSFLYILRNTTEFSEKNRGTPYDPSSIPIPLK